MSLINDALKRAKQAQASTPPPPDLDFRTVDRTAEQQQRHQKRMLALMMGVVVLLAALLIWQMIQPGGSRLTVPTQKTSAVVATAPVPAPEPVTASAPAAQVPDSKPIAPRPAAVEPPAAAPAPAAAINTPAASPAEPVATPAPAPESAPPSPPKVQPKLQSIVFDPQRPSAMISGKIVHIGDKFGEWRITGIDQESATLVASGITNVLVLQQ